MDDRSQIRAGQETPFAGKPPHRMGRWLVLAVMVALFTGCATVGQEFPVSPIAEIRIGETSKDDVRELFGAPWRVGVENGKRTWTYGHYRYRLIGDPSTRDLLIRFNHQDLVEHFSFNTTDHGGQD